MTILQVVPHYLPATRYGGPQRVAHSLAHALQAQGHEVIICTTNLEDEERDLDVPTGTLTECEGVPVYYERTCVSRYWGFSPDLARRVKTLMKTADVALIHAHYQFANLAGAWLARHSGTPYVLFSHGSLHRQGIGHRNSRLKQLYLQFLEGKNLREAMFIAFNAQEEAEHSLYQERGVVIPNGIDPRSLDELPPKGRTQQRYPEMAGKTLYLFLGRLDVQQKGLDILIPAFARAVKQDPRCHLIVAGPDENGGLAAVEGLIQQHGIEKSVTITGLVTGAGKLGLLQDADVFLLPSRFEGSSIALLEALFSGLPALVTDQVGLWTDVRNEKAGLVIGAEDVEALADGLLKLADPAIREPMSGRGRELVLQRYTWPVIATQLAEAIEARRA